jgi:hypothetical protein
VDSTRWLEDRLLRKRGMPAVLAEAARIVPLLEDSVIEDTFHLGGGKKGSVKQEFMEYMRGRPTEAYVRRCLSAVMKQVPQERILQEYRSEMARSKPAGVDGL